MISSLWSHQLCFHGTLRKRRTPWHLSNAKSSAAAAHATSSHHSHLCSSKRLARFTSVHRLHCQPAAGAGVGFEGRVCIGLDAAAPGTRVFLCRLWSACTLLSQFATSMYCEVLLKAVLQTNLLVAASANNLAAKSTGRCCMLM